MKIARHARWANWLCLSFLDSFPGHRLSFGWRAWDLGFPRFARSPPGESRAGLALFFMATPFSGQKAGKLGSFGAGGPPLSATVSPGPGKLALFGATGPPPPATGSVGACELALFFWRPPFSGQEAGELGSFGAAGPPPPGAGGANWVRLAYLPLRGPPRLPRGWQRVKMGSLRSAVCI